MSSDDHIEMDLMNNAVGELTIAELVAFAHSQNSDLRIEFKPRVEHEPSAKNAAMASRRRSKL